MIEHLIAGKALPQFATSGQSAVPLMSGVTTSGGSRKGVSSKTPGTPGSGSHNTSASAVKGNKPLPIRQQSTRAAVILSTTSGVTSTRSSSSRKGATAAETFLPNPASPYTAWGGPTQVAGEASHPEMNFASVAAAGVVRPAPNTTAAVTSVPVSQTPNIKPTTTAPTKSISGFPTLSESLNLSTASGMATTSDLNSTSQPNTQLGTSVSQSSVQPPQPIVSTAVVSAVGKPLSVNTRISGQATRENVTMKTSPGSTDDTIMSIPSNVSADPRFPTDANISVESSSVSVGPTMPATVTSQANVTSVVTSSISTKTVFNRAPGSHRPKPSVASTTTTTTTNTTIVSEPSVELPSEPQPMSMATSLALLTPPLSVTTTTVASTHTTSSRASPSTSPFPTTSTPVSVSTTPAQATVFPAPATPLPSGSPPVSISVASPVVTPSETRPVQSLVAIVAPSVTPSSLPPSTSLSLSNLTTSATCSTMSPINPAPHVPTAPGAAVMMAQTVPSVPAPIAPPTSSYPQPPLNSMMAPPGMVSNTCGETGMTLPRISSLNPGANTFEPRVPNTLPLNIMQGAAQIMQSGPAQQQLHNSLRGSFLQQQQQQQQMLHFEALRMAGGNSSNGNFSGSGADPATLMGVRTNDAQLAAAAVISRPMYGNMPSTVGGSSNYFSSNAGNLGHSMLNNATVYGGSQQQSAQQMQQTQQQQQQHSGLIGNRNSSLPPIRHLYQQPQQQLGSGSGESGLNSPQQMLMMATGEFLS